MVDRETHKQLFRAPFPLPNFGRLFMSAPWQLLEARSAARTSQTGWKRSHRFCTGRREAILPGGVRANAS